MVEREPQVLEITELGLFLGFGDVHLQIATIGSPSGMISPSARADFAARGTIGIVRLCLGGLFRRRLIGLSLGFLRCWLACPRNRLAGVFQVFQALVELLLVSIATAAGANRKKYQ